MNVSGLDYCTHPDGKLDSGLSATTTPVATTPVDSRSAVLCVVPSRKVSSVSAVSVGGLGLGCPTLMLPMKQTPICSASSTLSTTLSTGFQSQCDQQQLQNCASDSFKQGRVLSTAKRSQFGQNSGAGIHSFGLSVALHQNQLTSTVSPPSLLMSSIPSRSFSCNDGSLALSKTSNPVLASNNVSLSTSNSLSGGSLIHLLATPQMQYRKLGKSGLRLSCLGLGTFATFANQIDDETAEKLVMLAYENGINYFDTAEIYAGGRAEVVLGNILQKAGWKRSTYVISTKLYCGGKAVTESGLSRKHIIEGMAASLSRLQLQNVDIVFANKCDTNTPMEEVVRAFTWLINQGQSYYWGTCRWSPAEIMEAFCVARQFNLIPPICDQSEYHMFQRHKIETQMPELYHKIGIGSMAWSPLAAGVLTNKYKSGIPLGSRASLKGFGYLKNKISVNGVDEGIYQTKLDELESVASRIGCTLAQLAVGWCLKNEAVSCVLLGASSVDQLKENIDSLKILPLLTPKLLQEVELVLCTRPSESRVFESAVFVT